MLNDGDHRDDEEEKRESTSTSTSSLLRSYSLSKGFDVRRIRINVLIRMLTTLSLYITNTQISIDI